MEDQDNTSPWEKMKQANERRVQFEKKPPVEATLKQTFKYLWKVSFFDYLKRQFPKVEESEDSDMYFGWYGPKQNAVSSTWTLISKRQKPDRQSVRRPMIILGRRVGIFGAIVGFISILVLVTVIRSVVPQ